MHKLTGILHISGLQLAYAQNKRSTPLILKIKLHHVLFPRVFSVMVYNLDRKLIKAFTLSKSSLWYSKIHQ